MHIHVQRPTAQVYFPSLQANHLWRDPPSKVVPMACFVLPLLCAGQGTSIHCSSRLQRPYRCP